MVTVIKPLRDFEVSDEPLLVGLPGMGRVGFTSLNYILSRVKHKIVAELYSTSFPSHLIVGESGVSELLVGKLYRGDGLFFFTAETQPQNPEGQNEVCYELLNYLTNKGKISSVISTAAYVMPQVSEKRRAFVAGNSEDILKKLVALGGTPLKEGVIMGINGAVVGWSKYFGIKAAVVLGETWSAIVEFNETDYRAAKAVIDLLTKYFGLDIDSSPLNTLANSTERKILEALEKLATPTGKGKREPGKEVL